MLDIQAIRERASKATPGPWFWDVNAAAHLAQLKTTHSGQYYVMEFTRWGLQSAAPEFQKYERYEGPVDERRSMGMRHVKELTKPRQAHHPDFNLDIDHPDAQFIAAAITDVPTLLAEVERLRELFGVIQRSCDGGSLPSWWLLERCNEALRQLGEER